MEVHHHPDLHHKKKNFKEYFLEFLMITSKNIESKVFDFSQLNFKDNVAFRFIHENKPLTLITHD